MPLSLAPRARVAQALGRFCRAVGDICHQLAERTLAPDHEPGNFRTRADASRAVLMEGSSHYDALIIGGGPGGSSAATFLARAAKRVLLLEKEVFPRFHIGESLLPYNTGIFEQMGVLPAFEAAGFTLKHGAQFVVGNGSKCIKLVFRSSRFTRQPLAFQVERSRFDHVLLKHARASGADVREGWTVLKAASDSQSAQIEARDPARKIHAFSGSFLIDASGRGNVTGNQQGLRVVHPHMKKLAVFSQFSGVALDTGEKAGDTIIVRLHNKWFWIIPLTPEKVSVGCVLDQAEFAKAEQPPEKVFDRLWRSSPVMCQHLRNASPLAPFQTTSDFSYYNRRLIGPRLMRVGDAAGFMDPIFSAGVFLAMNSGKLAAELVLDSLAAADDGQRRLRVYEKRVYSAMRLYWNLTEHFYRTPFIEVFLEPRHRFDLPAAVLAILAGETEGGWKLWWRMRMFFTIVRLQAWWPLVPRLRFD